MKKRKVIVLHYSPMELYPPLMNFLNYAGEHSPDFDYVVISSASSDAVAAKYVTAHNNIQLVRTGNSGSNNWWTRLYRYFSFYLSSIWLILKLKPSTLVYYETLSCLPAYICKKVLGRSFLLIVHYHEYVSSREFLSGSRFFRLLWNIEKKIIQNASWISHTNNQRLKMFCDDYGIANSEVCRVMPNYPPASWRHQNIRQEVVFPVKIVYVGSLSSETMYLKEFAKWVKLNNASVHWDIYSINPDTDALAYLDSLKAENICFKGAVRYDELPSVLNNYDVGVVLYKGHIPNFIENAPNKLFEYHVCGLDVWFPTVMKGCLPYVTVNTYPQIRAVDFENLDKWEVKSAMSRSGLQAEVGKYSCEEVLPDFLRIITKQ